MWSLADPIALILLPLPLAARLILPSARRAGGALYVPPGIAGMLDGDARERRPRWQRHILCALLWACTVLALAGPQQRASSPIVEASGRDIVLAIDLSGSMEKQDFHLDGARISRLDAVKRVASRFVLGRTGDRIGLVVFGDRAYFAAPLTFDVKAVSRAIEEATIGISGRSTAISDGLGLALKRLSESASPSRVVVLLSDGIDTTGVVSARDAAALARKHGVRVHTIALGPNDREADPNDRDAVDTATLRAVATASGGTTFRVRTMGDLAAMADSLDKLEPNPSTRPPLQVWRDWWPVPAAAALVIAGILALAGRLLA